MNTVENNLIIVNITFLKPIVNLLFINFSKLYCTHAFTMMQVNNSSEASER